jgi:hypothetical protein
MSRGDHAVDAGRLPALLRLLGTLALAGAACHTAVEPEDLPAAEAPPAAESVEQRQGHASRRAELVFEMERRMNDLIRSYTGQLDAIRERLETQIDSLMPPVRLLAVERTVRGYGAGDHEQFEAMVDFLVDEAVVDTVRIVGQERRPGREAVTGLVEQEAMAIAADVGGASQGAGYGFVSGVEEVDERARVTIDWLKLHGDPEDLRDLGEIKKSEALSLSQRFVEDISALFVAEHAPKLEALLRPTPDGMPSRVGRLLLFESEVEDGFRFAGADTMVAVIAFQNERLPEGRELEFVQASRSRIVRGGMVVRDFDWRLDGTLPGEPGILPQRADFVDPRFIASDPIYPTLNVDHAMFEDLKDFTVIYDFATGVRDVATGEFLGAVRWQLRWIVTALGNVRSVDAVAPSFDPAADVLRSLWRSPQTGAPVATTPAPSDRLPVLLRPWRPSFTPLDRPLDQLGEARPGPIVTPINDDQVRLSAAGRRYLAAHRLSILASTHFLSYLEGYRNRYVLRLSALPADSPLRDLGFRSGDDILSINGIQIGDFEDLWSFLAAHPDEARYEVHFTRDDALRRLIYECDAGDGAASVPLAAGEESAENLERIDFLLGGGDSVGGLIRPADGGAGVAGE